MTDARTTEERAASWLIRREEPGWTDRDQAALDAWLDESLAHKASYWRLEHGWRAADRIAALGSVPDDARHAPVTRRTVWLGAIAASLAALISIGVVQSGREHRPPVPRPVRYATELGGHEKVPLSDGSRVDLNTATAIRTRLTAARREVWLDRGEAYFEVAHRNGETFVVHAGNRTITVLGTKFSVRRSGDEVTVAVVEGRVRVDDAARPADVPAAIITAGNVAIGHGPTTLLATRPEAMLQADLAWRNGLLRFDDVSLADAVAQFNRYNRDQISIVAGPVGDIRIGGTFQADNADAFVRLLRDAYGLRVEPSEHGFTISS